MDDAAAALERAITDAATLLLRLEKYQRGAAADVTGLRRALDRAGARARRSHRAADDETLAAIAAETHTLVRSLAAILAEVHEGAAYRAAIAAHRRGEYAALRPLLTRIFSGLAPAPQTGPAFAPVPWNGRRGPRSPDEVVAALRETRRTGLSATDDALELGLDPALPAVRLLSTFPDGAPVALRCDLADVAPHALVTRTGAVLIHARSLRVPFEVVFRVERDAVDEWLDDPVAYHARLAPRLEAAGFVTRRVDAPAAP